MQVGLPGGTFVYAVRLDDLQKQCQVTADGAELLQAPAGTEDRSGVTFIPYSRQIMGKGLNCYSLSAETISILQGDFVTCGVAPSLLESGK